ncbi:MAG: riboflavin synthase [Spirochaetia bacterium]
MFTGLIEAVGSIAAVSGGSEGLRISVLSPAIAAGLSLGDSVNIDGACQTVVAVTPSTFAVEAVGDTLVKTTFRGLKRGARVNLERAMRADGRFGGHMVTGHVTGTSRIISWGPGAEASGGEAGAWFLVLALEPAWEDRVVPEGSIAVDGISLTVAEITRGSTLSAEGGLQARVSIIPHTRLATTLAEKKAGDRVNIELDILASYVRAAMKAVLGTTSGVSMEKLREWGYS